MSKKVTGRFYIFLLIVLLVIVTIYNFIRKDNDKSQYEPDPTPIVSPTPTPSPTPNATPDPQGSDKTPEDDETEKIVDVEELVKPYIVNATITKDAPMYQGRTRNSSIIGEVKKGDKVQLIIDNGYQWYFIKTSDNMEGWVEVDCLSIPEDTPSNKDRLTDEQLEEYIVIKDLDSPTPYLVWMDIDRQMTYIFKNTDGKWKIHKQMVSSSGLNKSPTLTGVFQIKDRGEWFYNERLDSGFSHWVRYEGVYLFHSVSKDRNGNIVDDTLGERSSAGCIRLSDEDSKWFYDNIPEGTTVLVQ